MKTTVAYTVLALAIAFAVSPAFIDPFSGFRADQLPVPQVDPPIQPAGYAFAIWGLIYAWLIVSAVYGVWKRRDADDWHRARLPLIVSLAVGTPWLAIANASAIWATVTIIIMAVFAIWSLLLAPGRDRWLFQAPTAIYAGWLTAASCVSLGSTGAGYGLITDAYGWAFIGVALALAASIAIFLKRRSAPEYLATVIWALVGIVVANGLALPFVSIAAAAGIVILAGIALTKTRTLAAV